jgi:copper chaperone CopZ
MIETQSLPVQGMTCGGCEHAVQRALQRLHGVQSATASHRDHRVTVTFDPAVAPLATIRSAIEALGYTVGA